jgi:hypothetical protein
MDIESAVTSFCKRTPTAKIAWTEIVTQFLKAYPDISREDFELCMLRQGKRAALAMKDILIKHKDEGGDFDQLHKLYDISEAFWDACVATDSVPYSRHTDEVSVPVKRSYRRNPATKIYITIFRVPADEYSKESIDILGRFINSLDRPLQVIECANPRMIEVRELKK